MPANNDKCIITIQANADNAACVVVYSLIFCITDTLICDFGQIDAPTEIYKYMHMK